MVVKPLLGKLVNVYRGPYTIDIFSDYGLKRVLDELNNKRLLYPVTVRLVGVFHGSAIIHSPICINTNYEHDIHFDSFDTLESALIKGLIINGRIAACFYNVRFQERGSFIRFGVRR